MTLGYNTEVHFESKKIFISKGIFHKVDIRFSKEIAATPGCFQRWIGKSEIEEYIKSKIKDGYEVFDYRDDAFSEDTATEGKK